MFTTGLYRPLHGTKQTSHIRCSHSAGVEKDFRKASYGCVYIYSHKI